MSFTFGTLCSGIGAPETAFAPIGGGCRYVAEIEPYPCGVLADRFGAGKPLRMPSPDEAKDDHERKARIAAIKAIERFPRWGDRIPNYGDLTQIDPDELPAVDLVVAGPPCQDFSIAGLRQSLAGARGNLTLYYVKLVHELARRRKLRSILYENVPDLLNTKDNAFGAFLGGLVGHDAPIVSPLKGRRWTNAGVADGPLGTASWRVEDAQYSRLAQRRERLFLVASFGDGPDPLEVLLERQGLSRDPPPRRKAGEGVAGAATERTAGGGASSGRAETGRPGAPDGVPFGCDYGQEVGRPLVAAAAGNRSDLETETVVVGTLTANGKAAGSATQEDAEQGLLIPTGFVQGGHFGSMREAEVGDPLRASGGDTGNGGETLIAHTLRGDGFDASEDGTGRGTPLVPVTYSIMPQNSGKDFKAREVDVAQPGHGASHPNAGGQVAVAFVQNSRSEVRLVDGDGQITGAIAADAGAQQQHYLAFSLRGREGGAMPEVETGDISPGLRAADGGSTRPFVAFQTRGSNLGVEEDLTGTLAGNADRASGSAPMVAVDLADTLTVGANQTTGFIGEICASPDMAVRHITVVEACRLQGFDDFHTLIEWPTANRKGRELAEQVAYLIGHGFTPEAAAVLAQTPDGPQYKAIGNSKAVPLVRKIGVTFASALERYLASQDEGVARAGASQ